MMLPSSRPTADENQAEPPAQDLPAAAALSTPSSHLAAEEGEHQGDSHAATTASTVIPIPSVTLDVDAGMRESDVLAMTACYLGANRDVLFICPPESRPIANILLNVARFSQLERAKYGPNKADFVPLSDRPSYTTDEVAQHFGQSPKNSSFHYDRVTIFGLPELLRRDNIPTLLSDWEPHIATYFPCSHLVLELYWGEETTWESLADEYDELARGTGMELSLINSQTVLARQTDDEVYQRWWYASMYSNLATKLEEIVDLSEENKVTLAARDSVKLWVQGLSKHKRDIDVKRFRREGNYTRPGDRIFGYFSKGRVAEQPKFTIRG